MPDSVFGNILVPSQIEQAVINILIKWYTTYLREIERQISIKVDSLPSPQNYTNRNSFDSTLGESLPKVVVISPGTVNDPTKQGNGQHRALWRVGVGVATAAKDEVIANMMVKCYGAAARAIIVQNKKDLAVTLSGLANVYWMSETYDDLPITDQLNLFKSVSLEFILDIDDVVNSRMGPQDPNSNPENYGQAQSVTIDLVKEAII